MALHSRCVPFILLRRHVWKHPWTLIFYGEAENWSVKPSVVWRFFVPSNGNARIYPQGFKPILLVYIHSTHCTNDSNFEFKFRYFARILKYMHIQMPTWPERDYNFWIWWLVCGISRNRSTVLPYNLPWNLASFTIVWRSKSKDSPTSSSHYWSFDVHRQWCPKQSMGESKCRCTLSFGSICQPSVFRHQQSSAIHWHDFKFTWSLTAQDCCFQIPRENIQQDLYLQLQLWLMLWTVTSIVEYSSDESLLPRFMNGCHSPLF